MNQNPTASVRWWKSIEEVDALAVTTPGIMNDDTFKGFDEAAGAATGSL